VGARFLTRDPLASVTRDPYGYALNNPVNYVDPSGQFGIPILAAVAVFEIGSTLWDAYDAYQAFSDDCSGGAARWFSGGALLAGILLPGGRHGSLDDPAQSGARFEGELRRSAQKLEQHQGNLFPKVVGDVDARNALGQHVLEDILTSPALDLVPISKGHSKGGFYAIDRSTGRGAVYDSNDVFQYSSRPLLPSGSPTTKSQQNRSGGSARCRPRSKGCSTLSSSTSRPTTMLRSSSRR